VSSFPGTGSIDANAAGSNDLSAWEARRQGSYRVPLRGTLGWELIAPVIGFGEAAVRYLLERVRGTSGKSFMSKGARGENFSLLERSRYVRDKSFVVQLCVQAINRLFDVSGGRALYSSQRIQRIYRDAHALSHRDGFIIDFAGEALGKEMLASDAPFP
jgi:Acyl-CoA dehydrogenase, C-terminal domain